MTDIEYTLTRSKRKSVSLVIRDGKLCVKAPLKTPVESINKFILEKREWIADKIAKQKFAQDEYAKIFDFDELLFFGNKYSIEYAPVRAPEFSENIAYLPLSCVDINVRKKQLIKYYKTSALNFLNFQTNLVAKNNELNFSQIHLTNAKSKWGSCDSKNVLRFNWRLILLNEDIINYVIIHELCHTVHHNHSKAFWELVGKFLPTYKYQRKKLKSYSVLMNLLR